MTPVAASIRRHCQPTVLKNVPTWPNKLNLLVPYSTNSELERLVERRDVEQENVPSFENYSSELFDREKNTRNFSFFFFFELKVILKINLKIIPQKNAREFFFCHFAVKNSFQVILFLLMNFNCFVLLYLIRSRRKFSNQFTCD